MTSKKIKSSISTINELLKFFKVNFIYLIFGFSIIFVGYFLISNLFLSRQTFVYVKVKVGQGYWWASTLKPSLWLADSIRQGEVVKSLIGGVDAEILDKRQYRYYGGDQYDIFVDLKLRVDKTKNGYHYDRSTIAVGSPVDINFPSSEISGTVMELSNTPFEKKLVKKKITMIKKYSETWEFDAIKIGANYFDGRDKIFEVTDKSVLPSSGQLSVSTAFTQQGQSILEPSNKILVTADVFVTEKDNNYILGEDQILSVGKNINISTPSFLFDNYTITKIE